MKYSCLFASLLCLPSVATAMPTSEFITRWHAAAKVSKSTGLTPTEITKSPELKLLFNEFSTAAQIYRQQILSARNAGTQPRACPPKEVNLSVDGVIADVELLPVGWQSRDLIDTFGSAMDLRYPCGTAPSQ